MTPPFSQASSLSPEQRRQFLEDGLTRVPGAIPADAVEAMAERIWRVFGRRFGYLRDQPQTWTTPGAAAVIQPVLIQMSHAGVFAGMLSRAVNNLLDEVFGERGWQPPRLAPRPLGLLFPTHGRPWSVPTRNWHLDFGPSRPTNETERTDRLRLFGYLGAVKPGGGGTFYVAGSHRAVGAGAAELWATRERVTSSMAVKRLRGESDWFAELCSKGEEDPGRVTRFMREGASFRDIPVRVAEMTGAPGDLVIWHPNLLHAAPSSNQRAAPRLILSTTIDAGEAQAS